MAQARRLDADQTVTGRKLRALQPALQRRQRWERQLAPALSARAEALGGEIARRVETRVAEIEHEAPAYLAIALGSRPEGSELARGAAAIEDRRERHGVTEPATTAGLATTWAGARSTRSTRGRALG